MLKDCKQCDFTTSKEYNYCPSCGSPLEFRLDGIVNKPKFKFNLGDVVKNQNHTEFDVDGHIYVDSSIRSDTGWYYVLKSKVYKDRNRYSIDDVDTNYTVYKQGDQK